METEGQERPALRLSEVLERLSREYSLAMSPLADVVGQYQEIVARSNELLRPNQLSFAQQVAAAAERLRELQGSMGTQLGSLSEQLSQLPMTTLVGGLPAIGSDLITPDVQRALDSIRSEIPQLLPNSYGIDISALTLRLPSESLQDLWSSLDAQLAEYQSASGLQVDSAAEVASDGLDIVAAHPEGVTIADVIMALVVKAGETDPARILLFAQTLLYNIIAGLVAIPIVNAIAPARPGPTSEVPAAINEERLAEALRDVVADAVALEMVSSTSATLSRDAHLRAGPGGDHDVARTLEAGQPVRVLQMRDGWCYVELESEGVPYSGWVSAELLETSTAP